MAYSKSKIGFDKAKGLYSRTIGYRLNSAGERTPARFWLGRDERRAKIANAKLEEAWDQLGRRWSAIYGNAPPVWDHHTLPIAEARL